ncbi:unnamed protein product [Pleuronectes platessa]|uniref:Uncharacterized protein n=1 Tax=Pleuronectes platessa TaxID=8262 RepID=A0A9N7YKM4_PLEPL|nr:unnamed protein product [Pleuronectes platessa]
MTLINTSHQSPASTAPSHEEEEEERRGEEEEWRGAEERRGEEEGRRGGEERRKQEGRGEERRKKEEGRRGEERKRKEEGRGGWERREGGRVKMRRIKKTRKEEKTCETTAMQSLDFGVNIKSQVESPPAAFTPSLSSSTQCQGLSLNQQLTV